MRTAIVTLVAALLLPYGGSAAARPQKAIAYEDPDDTAGPFDVLSVTRTSAKLWGAPVFQHRIRFQERWDDDVVQAQFFFSEHGFDVPARCSEDDCTGHWAGEIYEDERGNLHAYAEQLMNCNDCTWTTELPVLEDDGDILLLWPRSLLYDDTDYYTMQFRFDFSNTLGRNSRVDCRLSTCTDYAADEESAMRFPVGR